MDKLSDHLEEIEDLYFNKRLSYGVIGKKYGKTREAVRQFLNRHFPDRISGVEFRKDTEQLYKTQAEQRQLEQREKSAKPCVVCTGPVYVSNRITCNSECADLWVYTRHKLDPTIRDKQRTSLAKSILKYPDKHSESKIKWANKVLNGENINSIHIEGAKDSKSYQAMQRVIELRKQNAK